MQDMAWVDQHHARSSGVPACVQARVAAQSQKRCWRRLGTPLPSLPQSRSRTGVVQVPWKYLVIDEAQRMKDRESKLAKAFDRFTFDKRLLLTGEPPSSACTHVAAAHCAAFPVHVANVGHRAFSLAAQRLAAQRLATQRLAAQRLAAHWPRNA
jgi:SNF2-related domain